MASLTRTMSRQIYPAAWAARKAKRVARRKVKKAHTHIPPTISQPVNTKSKGSIFKRAAKALSRIFK